jgi:hypothetical protein
MSGNKPTQPGPFDSPLQKMVDFMDSLQEQIETGNYSDELKHSPEKVKEKLREVRAAMIAVNDAIEQMERDPNEVVRRVTDGLERIEIEYPRESKFLKMLVEQKLAPESFVEKALGVFCDVSEAQQGLVGPHAALAAVQNYIELLKLLRFNATLRAEMDRLVPESK